MRRAPGCCARKKAKQHEDISTVCGSTVLSDVRGRTVVATGLLVVAKRQVDSTFRLEPAGHEALHRLQQRPRGELRVSAGPAAPSRMSSHVNRTGLGPVSKVGWRPHLVVKGAAAPDEALVDNARKGRVSPQVDGGLLDWHDVEVRGEHNRPQ